MVRKPEKGTIKSGWWDLEHMTRATETQRSQRAYGKGARSPKQQKKVDTPRRENCRGWGNSSWRGSEPPLGKAAVVCERTG